LLVRPMARTKENRLCIAYLRPANIDVSVMYAMHGLALHMLRS